MNKHLSSRSTPLNALVVAISAVLVFLFVGYGATRLLSRGEVMGRVEVAGTPIGGLDEGQALSALLAVEDAFVSRPAVFNIEGKFVSMQPPEAGLDVDEQAIADEAMLIGRDYMPRAESCLLAARAPILGPVATSVRLTLQ